VDFSFTDEQQHLRRSVREFAESEIAPHVMEWDEASRFPSELIPKLGEMELLGVIFPEEYGGAGLGYVEYMTVIEELARVDGSVGLIVAAHNSLCTNHIYKFGNEEQRKKYVIPLAQGKKLGCWSLTEPEAGSDAGGTRTVATRKDGGWIINGAKTFTTNGTMPTFVSPWLSPTKPKDRKEYPPSSSKREIQDSAQAKKKTNSACGRAILPKSSSPIVLFPRRIYWARKARAS